eukprot:CAMPEP_0175460688 /NCGR_PEP_ID=MMETSP0095-20121207/67773_1 /TAXON_ID=311494 /ORGANISM="Alexandrium monilatum, Strain CCMP3105" /LENGTH=57 /DNA_ID=CAMNT_0016761717 /DNA_START=27 /DNA_END=196 /DNA_ORIENTATION=-
MPAPSAQATVLAAGMGLRRPVVRSKLAVCSLLQQECPKSVLPLARMRAGAHARAGGR